MKTSSGKIIMYGSDIYRSRRKIQEVAENRVYIENPDLLEDAVAHLGQAALFGGQMTYVFVDLLKDLVRYKNRFFSSSNWIIWERSDKLTLEKSEKKEWEQHAEFLHFKPLSESEVYVWLAEEGKKCSIALSRPVMAKLLAYHGSNLACLENEIEKLKNYAIGRDITVADVELLCSSSQEEPLFELIDMVAHKKTTPRSKVQLQTMLNEAGDERHVFYMVVKHLRLLLRQKTNTKFDAHPFVQKKIAQQSQLWTVDELVRYLNNLLWIDVSSKRGEGELRELFMLQLLQPSTKDFA